MAAGTVVKFILAVAFGYLIYYFFSPLLYQTRYENSMWEGLPTNILAYGDQIHGIWLLIGVVIIAVAVFAAYNEADRNRALSA